MIVWMQNKKTGFKRQFFFSPLGWWTNVFNETLKINEKISLYELIEQGWEALK